MSADTSSSPLDAGKAGLPWSASGAIPPPNQTPQTGQYYRVDSSRASFTELWRDTRSPLVLFAWLTKLLRVKLPGAVNDSNVVSLWPFVVADGAAEETIPADVRQKFEPVIRELTGLGFGEAVFFSIHDRFHHNHTCQAALLHRDGETVARVTHRVEGLHTLKTHFFTEFLSAMPGGMFLHSSSARSQMCVPPVCLLNWDFRAGTSQLWVLHRQKLDAAGRPGNRTIAINGRQEMLEVLESHHEAIRDFNLARGVFSSMRGEDLAQAEALERSLEQARDGQLRYPEVTAQLDRLQQKQTDWTTGIVVLIVSIGLFIGAGAGVWKWSWAMLLMIVGVLLVHEAGHYLGMKLFNYSNVRMFFIPLLGAAVSGHHYTAPAWKKVIVSLMGPLPGIFLGGVLGVVGIIKDNDAMMNVATVAIVLNGLQLLPVLPLDGGRVMHALLFSRHYYLDTVFHGLAVGLLVGIGALVGDGVLFGLGVFVAFGVPVTYKVAKIATELRQQGFGRDEPTPAATVACPIGPGLVTSPSDHVMTATEPMSGSPPAAVPFGAGPTGSASAEAHAIPQPAAEAIIEQIQARFPRLTSPRQVAQLTLRVYELLVAKSSGVAAAVGFVLLHGVAFVVSLVLLLVIHIGKNPDLINPFAANNPAPTHSVDPGSITVWRGPSVAAGDSNVDTKPPAGHDAPALDEYDTVIATFSTPGEARRAFDEVKQEAPASAYLLHFGQSVLVSLPFADESARMRWFNEFDGRAEDVFIDGGEDFGAALTLTCRTLGESSAEDMQERLTQFFAIPEALCLIPPWAGDDLDLRSQDERARHETARAMFCKLQEASVADVPELAALRRAMNRAARQDNQDEYQRLSNRFFGLRNQLLLVELAGIRDRETDPIARELADRYIAVQQDKMKTEDSETGFDGVEDEEDWEELTYTLHAKERKELGLLMGQLPLPPDGSRPAPWTLRYSHSFGYAHDSRGNELALHISFEHVQYGAPVFLEWLKRNGCRDFKYELTCTGVSDYDEDY